MLWTEKKPCETAQSTAATALCSCSEEFYSPSWFWRGTASEHTQNSTKSLSDLNQCVLSAGLLVSLCIKIQSWEDEKLNITSIELFLEESEYCGEFPAACWILITEKKPGKNMWDSFGLYKSIRLAKPWTKHLIPAFCALVTPIHQQKFRCKKKPSLKIN